MTALWPAFRIATILALASTLAGGYGGEARSGSGAPRLEPGFPEGPAGEDREMLAAAIENLERQAAKLAAQPGAVCPQDFSALATGRTLRVSLFYGYDEHDRKVHDRAHAQAMAHVLTTPCRGPLSTCGFALVSRSTSAMSLTKTTGGRSAEVHLFTSSLAEPAAGETVPPGGDLDQERLSRSVKERFLRELVESDVVFYMGHSRLGGSIGFDEQMGITTAFHAIWRRPMLPVLQALRQRPTRLALLGLFSCDSNRYFRQDIQGANPALSLILTTGEVRYGPAEQASLGALEAVLAQNCGHAFHRAMISVTEPDSKMTYLFRGR